MCGEVDNGSRAGGDLAAAYLCLKVAERRAAKLGADVPMQIDRVQFVQDTGPQSTLTERIRLVLNQLMGKIDRIIDGQVIEEDDNG